MFSIFSFLFIFFEFISHDIYSLSNLPSTFFFSCPFLSLLHRMVGNLALFCYSPPLFTCRRRHSILVAVQFYDMRARDRVMTVCNRYNALHNSDIGAQVNLCFPVVDMMCLCCIVSGPKYIVHSFSVLRKLNNRKTSGGLCSVILGLRYTYLILCLHSWFFLPATST